MTSRTYIAIDLKSFYASVECMERHLDPMTVNLVVADSSRTEKTICLAVSPGLKSFGVGGRPRMFEVLERVKEVNAQRLRLAPYHRFRGKSIMAPELHGDPSLELDFLVAMPRMARYMEVSSQIYGVYLKYISPDDIHVYSIDEVFIDATSYLRLYQLTARQLAVKLIREVLSATGITASAGIGTNLYLCKIAMDMVAKHMPADRDGVRIAELTERSYREQLWTHQPLTDFWRVGRGYAEKLWALGIRTMGDIARLSLQDEEVLYRLFGINAELLIDHAWGWEPCPISAIKAYRPDNNCLCSGQVLQEPYEMEKGRLVVKEMTDQLSLDLTEKGLVTDQLVLTVGYEAVRGEPCSYAGPTTRDRYGRLVPKPAHGTVNLGRHTASGKLMLSHVMSLFDRIVNPRLLIRRLTVEANHVLPEGQVSTRPQAKQLELFTDVGEQLRDEAAKEADLQKERRLQEAIVAIKSKLGKNALLKGMNLLDGATAKERNEQIGGHRR